MKINPKISIIDYGVGNLYSLTKAVKLFTDKVLVTEEEKELLSSDAIILPGVGSFESGMSGLELRKLIEPINSFFRSDKPILGICLGAQILLSKGYEFGEFKGLDFIKGEVIKFPTIKNARVPHIGWNSINPPDGSSWDNTILKNINGGSSVYFVHSYILKPENQNDILAVTSYGDMKFCSAVKKGNVYGCQFHPEKSGKIGLGILENFINNIKHA